MNKIFSLLFILIVISAASLFSDLIENEISQDFVIEVKKIEIPNFQGAFNPSIIRWNGDLLMSFRIRNQYLVSTFEIGLVWLDEEFNPINNVQILDVRTIHEHEFEKEQDPRIVLIGDHLYIVYSNDVEVIDKGKAFSTRRVCFAEISFKDSAFYAEAPQYMLHFLGERASRWEKNWVPFDYNEDLLLAYSISPHKIFKPEGFNSCDLLAQSQKRIPWQWGELRGGTPALRLNDTQYLAFFHSSLKMATKHSNGIIVPHYVMGAYVFNAYPPFEITHISPEPIIAKKFYSGTKYKTYRPVCAIFPGGFIFEKKYILVAYGRQDHEIWLLKLDREGLLKSLKTLQ
jgi:predicted GH43/DUF377 family glycosyl hydrolase